MAAAAKSNREAARGAPINVRRSLDAAEINPVLNDPSVFPYVSTLGIERLDVSDFVADQRNVLLMGEGGGILALWQEPGIYEIHTAFLTDESSRETRADSYVLNFSLAAYRWMFAHTDCLYLLTRIPAHNRAALWIAPHAGWVKEFERKAAWATIAGELVDVAYYALRYDDWVRKTLDLMRVGREFHQMLAVELAREGKAEEGHADEDCHDLHVGACIEMVIGGQVEKAVAFYNRWARFAGYGLIQLVSREPILIDVGTALVTIKNGALKVVMVR